MLIVNSTHDFGGIEYFNNNLGIYLPYLIYMITVIIIGGGGRFLK